MKPAHVNSYLPFVQDTVKTLLERQSARFGGESAGTLFITMALGPSRAWTSVGIWDKDHYQLYDVRSVELTDKATLLDFSSWSLLKRLSSVSGDPSYAKMVAEMAATFADNGFDAKSGLILHGSMSKFDVVNASAFGSALSDTPYFKPIAGLPWDDLWAVAHGQMSRFCKATYFGLVTRPESMDFNRYVKYGFDDGMRLPAQKFDPMHRGFAYTAASLIHFWVMNYVHTKDVESLKWAEAMASKWSAMQDPGTGLLPHFIGAIVPDDPMQSPTPYANSRDSMSSVMLLETAELLDGHKAAEALRDQIRELGIRSLVGIAENSYDRKQRVFIEWLKMTGGEYTDHVCYTFRTQADKDAALKRDPNVARVDVFPGDGFFKARHARLTAGGRIPLNIAEGAAMTGDPVLIRYARELADEFMQAARARNGSVNDNGQWGFTATAAYIRALLSLRQATGEPKYLDWATELADREIEFLSRKVEHEAWQGRISDWWRMPGRCSFLESLLELEERGRETE